MDDIPPRSYGPLIETTVRIITWNVWGLYGPWPEREAAIMATLHDAHPDIVVLTESWSKGGWPIQRQSGLTFGDARVQFAELAGPRGLIQVFGLVMDAWWFDQSQPRQDAVRELLTWVPRAQDTRAPLIICGDFNADPDSDEIRMLTGRTTAPAPGLSFYDAWEVAGPPTPGHTWSNDNPWATQLP
jgi:hypothetical protein